MLYWLNTLKGKMTIIIDSYAISICIINTDVLLKSRSRVELESNSSMSHHQNLDPHVATFLARLNLTELTEIFKNEELDMDHVVNLSNEELREIGVSKLKHRKLILQETQTKKKGALDRH